MANKVVPQAVPLFLGYDEFFGNLYHLNAEEEPELPDYPKDPEYLKKFGPRGVLGCTATNMDDAIYPGKRSLSNLLCNIK